VYLLEPHFLEVTEEELVNVDGGALPLVVAGVSIWKIGAAVAGGAAALFAGGAALGYYANRP